MAEERYEEYERELPGEVPVHRRRRADTVAQYEARPARRISWGSVIAGSVVAMVVQLTLTLLGMGVGAAAIQPAAGAPFPELGIGAAIWLAVSAIISMFVGGAISARLANIPRKADAVLHGLVTWGLVSLLSFYVFTSAVGNLIGGAANVAGQAAGQMQGAPGGGAGGGPEGVTPPSEQQLQQLGEAATKGVTAASFGGFVVLLLGGGAAALGGLAGRPKRVLRDEVERNETAH